MKNFIKAVSTLLILYGGVHQWLMESPHKGPAMRKASIMQLQGWTCLHVCHQHYGKTNYTQQWPHVSILGFHLTGNSNCLFNIPYRKNETYNSVLLILYAENPLMTNGIAIQRNSSAKKRLHTTDPLRGETTGALRNIHTRAISAKNHSYFSSNILRASDYFLSLAASRFIRQPLYKTWKKTARLTPLFWSLLSIRPKKYILMS